MRRALLVLLFLACKTPPVASPSVRVTALADDGSRVIAPCGTDVCPLRGGRDSILVRVEYEGIEIDPRQKLTAPKVRLVADGVALPELTVRQIATAPATFEAASSRVPSKGIAELKIEVDGGNGYDAEPILSRVEAPVMTLESQQCKIGERCKLRLGIGRLTGVATAWVPDKTKGFIRSVVDGIEQTPSELTFQSSSTTLPARAAVDLSVPDRGNAWNVTVGLPDLPPITVDVDLTNPTAEVVLGVAQCPGTACTVADKATVDVILTAPRDIHDVEGEVRILKNGVYTPVTAKIPLDIVEGELRKGAGAITLPSAPGATLQLRATVGETQSNGPTMQVAPGG